MEPEDELQERERQERADKEAEKIAPVMEDIAARSAEKPERRRPKPRKGSHTTNLRYFQLGMTLADADLLDWLADYLSTSRSEAARTAIRSFAVQMKAISGDLRGRSFDK